MQPTPSANRTPRAALAAFVLALGSSGAALAQATPPTPAPGAQLSTLQGFVVDSIHDGGLAKAVVIVEGTGRQAVSQADGRYRIDSIPMGKHGIMVMHPVFDTLGLGAAVRYGQMTFSQPEQTFDPFVPSGERVASVLCTPAMRNLGPAVMVGLVRDPDTQGPAAGAKVQLVYTPADPIGLGRKMPPRVREAQVDSVGFYHICGLPADMSGKVQVFRNGVSSGEVPVEVSRGIALRSFSIVAKNQVIAEVKNDSGRVIKVAKGSATLSGKVVDKNGRPLSGARVMLQGGVSLAVTKPNGEFTLDSLPSGTQAVVVRKLGYAATEEAVELSANQPAHTQVTMGDFVPTLETVRVEAAADKALSDIGYLQRKQVGNGYFLDGKSINHESMSFADVMRVVPGLRISPLGDGRTYVIEDARSASNGCVNYWVDGTQWQTLTPGDINDAVQPSEIVAVEVYHGSQAPPQYTAAGQSGCAAVVIWTVARVHERPTKAKRP